MLSTSVNGQTDPHNDDDAPRTLDIVIDPPIEWNQKTYEVLHLEEPTGLMIEKAEAELAAVVNFHTLRKYHFTLVSLASGVPRAVIEKMRITQIMRGADFLATFKSGGPVTGGN